MMVDLENSIYLERVPMGGLVKGLVVFFSSIILLGTLMVLQLAYRF